MKRLLKWLAIGVVAVLVLTYVLYALDYKGNYNVTVSFEVARDADGIAIASFTSSSEPTGVVDFWDLFRSHGATEGMYAVVVELTRTVDGSVVLYEVQEVGCQPGIGERIPISVEFRNISPGPANVGVYVYELSSKVCERSYTVTVGLGA